MDVKSFMRREVVAPKHGNGDGDVLRKLTGAALLDPAVVTQLGNLDLVALHIVEGFLSGTHRSPFKGGCVEFAEHRAYSPGDEIRMIDWRAVARSDRYYIKQFEEDTQLQCVIVLGVSGELVFVT